MRVLVIPEDFRNDQYILKPLLEAVLRTSGKGRSQLAVCQRPLLRGVQEALAWANIAEILDIYPMVDLFVLVVDRDSVPGRSAAVVDIERQAQKRMGKKCHFFGVAAVEEIEVWLLAGLAGPRFEGGWREVRRHRDPKEAFYQPLASARGVADGPGGGRKHLGIEASKAIGRIRQLCPEFDDLARRMDGLAGTARSRRR